MITVVLVIVAAVLVAALVATAATATRQSERRRPPPRRRVHRQRAADRDAVASWVTRHLPYEISERLSQQDVRQIIDWNLEFFRSRTTSGNGHSASVEAPIVVAGAETVDYVLGRADAVGTSYTPAQVHAVLAAQMSYLESIGAMGEDPPEPR
jgi:Ni/Co efflux regulator RcnB